MLNVQKPTALLVIADEARRRAFELSLQNAGLQIRTAVNGDEALRMALDAPDILLLDLHLPDMSGFEVCCRLKAHAATAGIPVLHLSDTSVESAELAVHLEQGDEAYLTHPVKTVELLATIKFLLKSRHVQSQFDGFLEAAPDAVIIVNSAGQIVRVNSQAEKTFGHRREELLGKLIEILLPERYRDKHRQQRESYAANPSTRSMGSGLKLWGLRQDGTEFPVEISLSPIRVPEGILIASIVRDVTDRFTTEVALQHSEVRYRRLFETAKDGILILDTNTGKIADANPFMSELLGYPKEYFLGKELWEIGLFRDKAANESAVQKLQETGYIRYEHLPLENSKGQSAEVEIVANSYEADHHNVIQLNVRDITDRSRLEKQLQEQAVTMALLHSRKDEFLAMLSHELRNPLAPIIAAVQLLAVDKEPQDQEQARQIIERQVGQLTRLIDDLLEVSRITTGRIHLVQESIPLNGIVERALETTRPLIDQYGHRLAVSLAPTPVFVLADAARLEQVIVNLLTNAAKYTPVGGRISVFVEQAREQAVLHVRDTGVGIAPDLLPHIFDLFTQSERSLDRAQGGLGIGLCLVQKLVEMHGGKVEVTSELGQGSEFVVSLPLSKPPVAPLPMPKHEKISPSVATGAFLRVLVVDDMRDTTFLLSALLKKAGHEVRTANNGLTAIELALDFRPHVVLLDIGLPGIDGYEVAKRIRQEPSLVGVTLIALTGYGQETDIQHSLSAGFDHHLVKPADIRKVLQILANVSVNGR